MTVTAYDRILDRLREDGRTIKPNQTDSARCMAQCPAHEDRKPSLSIRRIESQVLVNCRAGCPTDDVLAALNMKMADLFDNPRETTYGYTDLSGLVVRTVVRKPNKQFYQKGHLDGPTPLYRLDRLTDATTVYLVEGEKDVHAIESLGLVATTAPMGADSFHKCDVTPLFGKTVIAIVDDDKAGATWAGKVKAALEGHCALTFRQAAEGKDAADHIAADLGIDQLKPYCADDVFGRHVVLTSAADIKPRRVKWLWTGRLALGTLGLLAGREGTGKSSLSYWLAAQVTLGTLPGEYEGTRRAVLVCATEDSWAHTIVPRLMAAGADLSRVYQVEVMSPDGVTVGLSLPRDLHQMEESAKQTGAAMLILDPLISRLSESLDSHKDGEVRRALEPLIAIADRTDMAILGLIHHNKSGSTDPLQLVMGSKAFTAVARSVHTVVPDPDDDTDARRLFGTPKNNLGSTDLPTLAFTMTGHPVETDEGTNWTARVAWGAESAATITDAMRRGAESPDDRSATSEAADWLDDYLTMEGGSAASADIKRDGLKAGHSQDSLKRAKTRLRLSVESTGFPRRTFWAYASESKTPAKSEQQSEQVSRGESQPALTAPTEVSNTQSAQLVQSVQDPARAAPTAVPTGEWTCAKAGCNSQLVGIEIEQGYCWPHVSYEAKRERRQQKSA